MMKRILILLALLLAACSSVPGKLEKPQVDFAGIQIEELGLFEQHFQVALRVTNPNNFDIPIDGVNARLDLNGEQFATGVSNEHVSLARLGSTVVKIRVTTNLGSALKQITQLQSGKKLSYSLHGNLFVPLIPGGVPFERKGELDSLLDKIPDAKGGTGQLNL